MFDALLGFDQPFNQVPSLHIALAVILWVLYARKTRGVARALLTLWFVLIGASVLTTYQHHFIDIPTGVALGWLCVWLWPFAEPGIHTPAAAWRTATAPARHRLALLYAGGALALPGRGRWPSAARRCGWLAGAVAGARRGVLRRARARRASRRARTAACGRRRGGCWRRTCRRLAQLALVDAAPSGAGRRRRRRLARPRARRRATRNSSASRASST